MTTTEQRPDVYVENDVMYFRASSVGTCRRSLVACLLGESASPPGAALQAAMDASSAREDDAINAYRLATGHNVIWEQKEVELPVRFRDNEYIIRGHLDGLDQEDDTILEVKSLGRDYFDKWNHGGVDALGSLGLKYKWQLAAYGHATGRKVRFVILNKVGERPPFTSMDDWTDYLIIEPAVEAESLVPMAEIAARLAEVQEWADRDEYPECDRGCTSFDSYGHIHVFAGVTLDSSGELDTLLEQYDEVVQRIKDDTDLKDSLRERLVMEYGVGKHATGRFNLNVQRVMSSRFDTGLFKRKHPDMYDQFLTPSESVRVVVKKVGDGQGG